MTRKNKFTKNEFEYKLHRLTSNDKKFPTEADYKELFYNNLTMLNIQYSCNHLKKKLKESGKMWRKILKSLLLIEFIYIKSTRRSRSASRANPKRTRSCCSANC